MHSPVPTRRWPRYPVDLPVTVVVPSTLAPTPISGRGTELSRGGMAVYAGVDLNPGDLMHVEFPTPRPLRIRAMVRNRSGFCFGVEFVSVMTSEAAALAASESLVSLKPRAPAAIQLQGNLRVKAQHLHAAMHRKQLEMEQVEKEIQALQCALPLLSPDRSTH